MRKLYLLLAFSLVTMAAWAQYRNSHNFFERLVWDDQMLNVMLDTRVDAALSTGNPDGKNLRWEAQTFKLWVAGEIVPGIRYRVRHRLNRSQAPNSREGFSSATDHAWVAFDMGKFKDWTLTIGKQSVQFGTFEYDYNPADIYLGTMIFNDVDAYKTGANLQYRFLGQAINLQIFNSDSPQFARDDWKNKAMAGSILWEGDLWNGAIKTRWAYTGFMHTDEKLYNWATGGIQFNAKWFTAETDYYFGDRNMDYSSVVDDAGMVNRHVRDQSASLTLKGNFGRLCPFIKGTWNMREDRDADMDAYQNWGAQGVLEFYPFTHNRLKDIRFHAAYAYNETNFKGTYENKDNKHQHMAVIGMRWLFKAK